LFDADGKVTAASERGETLPGNPVSGNVVGEVLSGRTAVVPRWGDGNSRTLTVALPMGPPEAAEGGIVVTARNPAGEAALARLRLNLMLLAAFALIAVTVAALWLAESLAHPLDRLAGVIARLARGDTSVRVPSDVAHGDAE